MAKKHNVSQLEGLPLDWAICKAAEIPVQRINGVLFWAGTNHCANPSTNWSLAGPIIEREGISLQDPCTSDIDAWRGFCGGSQQYGPTALVAAMRCYVASKLGNEIEIPGELL